MNQKGTLDQLNISQLKSRAAKLQKLCEEFDPYAPMSMEEHLILQSLGLKEEDYEDPFALTNRLIMQMEDTLEEIMKREGDDQGPTTLQ